MADMMVKDIKTAVEVVEELPETSRNLVALNIGVELKVRAPSVYWENGMNLKWTHSQRRNFSSFKPVTASTVEGPIIKAKRK